MGHLSLCIPLFWLEAVACLLACLEVKMGLVVLSCAVTEWGRWAELFFSTVGWVVGRLFPLIGWKAAGSSPPICRLRSKVAFLSIRVALALFPLVFLFFFVRDVAVLREMRECDAIVSVVEVWRQPSAGLWNGWYLLYRGVFASHLSAVCLPDLVQLTR